MKKNILIYPCGADNALEIYESIRYSLHLNVFGGNSMPSIADLIFENKVIHLPNITDDTFILKLNTIIKEYGIDLIFPTHDDVVYFFSKNLENIDAEVIGADPFTNEVARYKNKTYKLFNNKCFVPKVFNCIEEIDEYPIFCKPDKGHGSIGAFKINQSNEINKNLFNSHVITEFLPGVEYTVDCFTDKNEKLLYALPRKRSLVRSGVSHIALEANEEIAKKCFSIANEINEKLNFKGLWFYQVKEDKNGNLKLLEVCPRMATTMAFNRYKGVNLPLLTIFTYLDMEVNTTIINNNVELYRYSLTKPKYDFKYDNVYIDFDDTIIVNNQVCLEAIAFIYQSKNQGKKVILLTKHIDDIFDSLEKYSISTELFDEILSVNMSDSKYKYIEKTNSIFIDNYYRERIEVFEKLGIPVFDVEGIKTLLKF